MSARVATIHADGGRWALAIDGETYAHAPDPERLTRLAELAGFTVEHGASIGLSVRQETELTEALCRAVPRWQVHYHGLPESIADLAALSTVVAQLVEHAPEAARRLLERTTGGAPS